MVHNCAQGGAKQTSLNQIFTTFRLNIRMVESVGCNFRDPIEGIAMENIVDEHIQNCWHKHVFLDLTLRSAFLC